MVYYFLNKWEVMTQNLFNYPILLNGRVYDPLTAQFFSPDPVLQAPGNWTNYNRYTYCMNNPFKYTDPSGYIMVNDEEGNYHYDAGSGAYQSRFDERGSIYYNWNSGQYEYGNGEWAGFEALKNQLYSTSSYDCTYKGEMLEVMRDHMKSGYQMHHTNFYGRRGVVFSKGDPGIVTSDAGVIFINNTAYYLEGQRMAGSIGGSLKEWGASEYIGAISMLMGASGNQIGFHMSEVSRFAPLTTLDGKVVAQATSRYRFGFIPGAVATKLGAGLRIGGNLLGGFGIGYTLIQIGFNGAPVGKGLVDIGFGVVGFLGPVGLGVSAIYFVGDTFIPGGWQAVPQHQYYEIQMNSRDGVWYGAHNHFK